ncbi:uncharacterized protein LOC111340271 [Stylophora pistillata]|uniref:uncharacterized protein LOC111340271 n=1 Tax=Stylophora pistillata TaxID=50429 RepID=UPI000C041C98|nr:uncharacterized protein LOC111340271 [Stylophora pistillata]
MAYFVCLLMFLVRFIMYASSVPCKFDFESGLDGWVKTGTAFENQPTFGDNPTARNRGQPAQQQGDWWIGGFEDRPSKSTPAGKIQGDGPQGTLVSPTFKITGPTISFLIGGGCDVNTVRVELIVGIKVVEKETGHCTETMTRKAWDVKKFIGRNAHIKVVDSSSGGWGHINLDDLKGDMSCPVEAPCKFDFERGIHGWAKTGTAFDNQPTFGDNPTARNRGQPAQQQGDWWIGGFEDRPSESTQAGKTQGDGPLGTLTSPTFKITGPTISFLIGGGCDVNTVRVELIVGNKVVEKETGHCTETMRRKAWHVRDFIGQEAHVRLVDYSSGGWGHINFDDLQVGLGCPARCKFDFENGLRGWVAVGEAFQNQPTFGDNPTARNRGQPAHQQGDWWIGGYENRPSESALAGKIQGDVPKGILISPSFEITGPTISFLIGGGCDIDKVRVELVVHNQVVKKETGKCTETMARKIWNVGEFSGQEAHIKLVDSSSGGWGHINFDDLEGDISCSIGCQDHIWYRCKCPELASFQQYCQKKGEFMSKYCPRSCGFCGEQGPVPVKAHFRNCDCKDHPVYAARCPEVTSKPFHCQDELELMKERCPKSCGFC